MRTPVRARPRHHRGGARGDRGAAAVYAVTTAGLVLLLGTGLGLATAVVVDLRTAQTAADLAALAAASAPGRGAAPCAEAGRVASANGAELRSCDLDGPEVVVEVVVHGAGWLGLVADPTARARAGPASAGSAGAGGPQAPGGRSGPASASSTSSSRRAPPLSSGLFWLPHFGDCTQEGQPSTHSQSAIAWRVAPSQARAAA